MPLLLIVLIVVIALFALGFVVKVLFYVAVIAALIWLIGFFVRGTEGRWYRR